MPVINVYLQSLFNFLISNYKQQEFQAYKSHQNISFELKQGFLNCSTRLLVKLALRLDVILYHLVNLWIKVY